MNQDVQQILTEFEQINAIPRNSKHEEQISQWLQQRGRDFGYETHADEMGNVVITVPGTGGLENAPAVVIQGHMDMVCEKTPDSTHDFTRDPIKPIIDGDWLTADRTTLGSDNGIAIAMGLVLAARKDIPHPPLELLITVDEEQGLTGAARLQPGFVKGKVMLNLDSEDEGIFTIGCSGGRETILTLEASESETGSEFELFAIKVGGLFGGHSGVDIGKHRACANKLLARTIHQLRSAGPVRLVSLDGGTAHNAIPREAEGVVALPAGRGEEFSGLVREFEKKLRAEFSKSEKTIELALEPLRAEVGKSLDEESSGRLIDVMNAIPHGVIHMSADIEGKVDTSTSFAVVTLAEGKFKALTSQRSSLMSRLEEVSSGIASVADLAGLDITIGSEYPSWPANMDSPLIEKCRKTYNDLYGRDPEFDIIHAGLECAVIAISHPDMDMISLGPTIQNPHSPDERMSISSLEKTWNFLLALLKSMDS
jgi:dipeptidase D